MSDTFFHNSVHTNIRCIIRILYVHYVATAMLSYLYTVYKRQHCGVASYVRVSEALSHFKNILKFVHRVDAVSLNSFSLSLSLLPLSHSLPPTLTIAEHVKLAYLWPASS